MMRLPDELETVFWLEETIRKMFRKGMTVGQIADILEMEVRQVEIYLKN